MQTPQAQLPVNRFLVDQDGDQDSSNSTPITVPFRIGRLEGFDLSLPSPNVSALHAEILEEDGELWVYDLGSTNGTFVNDEPVRVKTLLRDNDTIVFGNRTFRLISSESESPNEGEVMATVTNAAPTTSSETSEQRFQRLLDSGAVPFFQPIYEISSAPQRLIGYEVLGRGTISGLRTPKKMFAAALTLEMESELSRVFRQRGIEAAQDKIPAEMKLFVNTHPAELNSSELEDSLHELRKGFPTRPIVLEISETILTDPSSISQTRDLLKNLDIGLALYNFGSGQIDMTVLNELDPEIVKFDCDLIHGIDRATPKHQRLVRALVKVVEELGGTPMAEYVESLDEHEALMQLGFKYAQGFHYGRPNEIGNIVLPSSETEVVSNAPAKVEPDAPAKVETGARVKVETGGSKLRPAELMRKLEASTPSQAEQDEPATPQGVQDTDWLMQQPQNHYTVQVMMSPLQEAVESFLDKQNSDDDFAIYHKPKKSQTWFVVLCGSFSDRAEAKLKAESFRNVGVSTLVRRLSSVHSDIRKVSEKAK